MLKRLLFGLGLALSTPALLLAQHRNCGTMDHLQQLEQQNPGTLARHRQVNRELAKFQEQASAFKTNAGVVTIPVVVHVLYSNASQNISDAQIQSQIDVLNEDFSHTNADAANTPAAFKPLAGDMQIRFELAKRNPDGDPTTGITRTQTSVGRFDMSNAMKFTHRGGQNSWDRNKYLNIWVCNLGSGLLGYAQFPGSGPETTDGVVIGYNYFGRTGVVSPPFNKGRTATHEVGHWLGLYHIWGDEPGCANDDLVADTPLQKAENFGCPSFPQTNSPGGACAIGGAGSMFMNYMDYVDDGCMNMFSLGQVARAQAALQTQRPGILTSDGATAVIVKPVDAAIFKINAPAGTSCDKNITPKAILKNRGTTPLTSAMISYKIDNGPVQNYQWSGTLNAYETAEIMFPVSTVSFGAHLITVSVTLPAGQTDNDPSNNAQSIGFTVEEQKAGLDLPFRESFEAPLFPPQGWTLKNPDGEFTWERTRRAAYEGFNSAFINNYDYEYVGEVDELEMPALNLSAVSEPKLTFKVAYASYSGSTSDSLEVLASADCGVSFTSIYKKGGKTLASIPNIMGNAFFPDTSQWRTDSVNLQGFAGNKNVILKFRSITGYENNLFIDDVQVTGKAALPQPNGKPISLFPNPTSGRFTLQLGNNSNNEATVIILNSIGQEIMNRKLTPEEGKLKLDLVGKADGIYFVHIISEGKTYKQKLVLDQMANR